MVLVPWDGTAVLASAGVVGFAAGMETHGAARTNWVRACGVDDIEPGESVVVDVSPPVAVFNVDGEFLATADTCTHAQSSLADGYIEGAEVECSWHMAKFCLRTGEALTLPATEPLATYATKVDGGEVFVQLGSDPRRG